MSQNIGKVWYFGQYAGMNFSTTPPTPLVGAMVANKGCATLTNSVDNTIIAYTDGKTLYNKNHQIALNGSSLNGDGQASNSSYFLPYPNKPNTAILFTVDAWGVYQNVNPNSKGLCYSIVKVDSSTGLAYVVSGQKNILLKKPTSEKLAVTKHANGIDYWVVTHGAASTNNENRKYFAYLVTNAGVSPTPVVSTVGGIHNNPIGELNISPNGQKVCATTFYSNWAELLNFNNSTGVVSNPVHFTIPRCLGVEFSPNSQYVYITETGPNDPNSIRQINIATNNMVSIANITGAYTYSQMATAPDGNIYVANSGSTFLGKITNPNNANATYIKNGLALAPTGVTSRLSVPYATEMPITMCIATQTTDTICHGASVTLADSINGQSVTWTFNPPLQSPDNFVNNVLTLYNATSSIKNTVCSASNIPCANTRQISVYPEIAKKPTKNIAVCSNQSINIGTNANANYSYQWSPVNNLNNPNISNPTVSISNTGNSVLVQKYYLTRTLVSTGCSVVDTVAVSVAPNVVFQDTNICHGASVTLADSINGQSVVWTFNPPLQSPDNFVNNVLTLYNATSSIKNTVCSASNIPCSDSLQVGVYPKLQPNATALFQTCSNQSINIGTNANANYSYQWSPVNNLNNPNISNPTVSISNTGNSVLVQKYYLTRTLVSTGCSVVDTVAVSVAPNVVFQDTNICHGASVTLADSINGESVTWAFSPPLQAPDNFTNNVLTLYNATGSIKNTVCSASNIPCSDSLQVGVYPKLQSNATALFQTCSNQSINIGTNANANYSYQWLPANNLTNPNISNPTVKISNTGNSVLVQKYYLTRTVLATGCKVVDTVVVSIPPSVALKDTNICTGASVTLADSLNGQSVVWTFNPPLQAPDNFTNNVLTLYNESYVTKKINYSASNISCAATATVSVDKIAIDANGHLICSELFIPNIITKNGDGKNDFLKIEGLNLFKTNKLQIYNRWGKKMYEQTDYNSDWNGESFMSGTYFYLLELTTYTGQTLSYKGWIDVME
ncbi:gliding motility-associated C-terminal domain-containing protein [Flexibacter flexilis]|uniref:gliding motility-associated C-terminal domain-containing protein n=1 Tax=Flexibacter flexilis TaxID=998 RepID=UPI001C875669|nr:gliding motility-associated C-terminal domain-containing protein [Flexibacter flexilis]